MGSAPDAGWFGYAHADVERSSRPGHGVDFWVLGLQILGIASLAARSTSSSRSSTCARPGMTLMRMPVFIWMTLVTRSCSSSPSR